MSDPTSDSSAAPPQTSSKSSNTVPFFLNGAEQLTSKTFPVTSAGTNQYLYESASAQTSDAEAAVAAAAAALPAWRALKPAKRAAILVKTAEVMNSRHDELAGYLTSETGATPAWADFNLKVTTDILIASAARVHSVEGIIPTPAGEGSSALIVKEPFGVVLAIAPWNAPYILGIRAIAGPLVTGNTVVLKGPSDAPAVTAALIAHRDVKKINFTGSTGVGRIIGPPRRGKPSSPCLLELGGERPPAHRLGKKLGFQLAAQKPPSASVVHKGRGAPALLSPAPSRRRRENLFSPAEAPRGSLLGLPSPRTRSSSVMPSRQGARVVAGDPNADDASPTRMRPVVLGGVTAEMDIYQTESFGPTVSLYEVETEEEALRIANDTEYGLSSAVFTEDLRRGLRFAKNIETGAVHINSMTVHDEPALPHGGAKASGYGRFNAGALEEWVRTKTITYQD
ncbi:salicylaldehyde dehydrogenase [Verticillium alfalfae VaMs.102]|uniref:Salicylaldehyde dehydrogenase n=1 Tax=Verticillium alfalfae (strain VaMs.102 / ATCC MYA-4576 / FGSC 10136) TaxID=526221 RepID=C9SQZ6_VERA1|nr:salicylaldehyde dehydrogenase [Verticillium alfalfae VaMs.102]EEY21271.1 salicylaldehyde dehydrogenase [Verticillium alfalfae VaMs.102]